MDVDLRLLRYFLAVADELHFGRAATKLYISQPALSQQVRKLELSVGTDLFIRDRRSVALTREGTALVAPAREVVAAFDAFVVAARRSKRSQRRQINIGFSVTWQKGFLSQAIKVFRDGQPDMNVTVRQYDFRDTSHGLRSGEMDVSLLHLPLDADGISTWPLFEVPRVAMLSESLPLAAQDTVTVADLVATGLPWAIPPHAADEVWRHFWGAIEERRDLGVDTEDESPQPHTVEAYFNMIATGAMLGLAEGALEETYGPQGIAFVPVSDLGPSIRAVGWRSDETRVDVRLMIDTICHLAGVPVPTNVSLPPSAS